MNASLGRLRFVRPHAAITGLLLESGCAVDGCAPSFVSVKVDVAGVQPSLTIRRTLDLGQYETVRPTLKECLMRENGLQVDEVMSRRCTVPSEHSTHRLLLGSGVNDTGKLPP